jgi:hypothetical protein
MTEHIAVIPQEWDPRSDADLLKQVPPGFVLLFDQFDFPGSSPFLFRLTFS